MAVKGILFDKDGTLVDFHRTWIPAYRTVSDMAATVAGNKALGDHLLRLGGYDPTTGVLDANSILAGGTTRDICDLWAAGAGIADRTALSRELQRAMEDYVTARPIPVGDGLGDLFRRLAARGLAIGLATMDGEVVARATASTLGIVDFVSFVCGYDSGYEPKPAPDMVHGFCTATGLRPREVMVIGDTARDMDMARAAGAALAVGVLTGATPCDSLTQVADRVIPSVFEIETVLL